MSKQTLNTNYLQQKQYFNGVNRVIYLRKAFRIDFVEFLKSSINQKYSLIICIDSNENMRSGKIEKLFTKLGLIELSQQFSSAPPLVTFLEGSK